MSTALLRRCLHLLLALSLSLIGGQALASAGTVPSTRDAIGASEMAHHGQQGHHARYTDAPPAPQAHQDDAEPFKRRRIETMVQWQTPDAADVAARPDLTASAPVPRRTGAPVVDSIAIGNFQARFLRACRGRAPPAA